MATPDPAPPVKFPQHKEIISWFTLSFFKKNSSIEKGHLPQLGKLFMDW